MYQIINSAKSDLFLKLSAKKTESKFDQYFYIFWLLGPFILLVERTPADAWLSVISIGFVIRSIWHGSWSWIRTPWVLASMIFIAACLLSALNSDLSTFSLKETALWTRFPIFACAVVFWLCRTREDAHIYLCSVVLATLTMVIILTLEMSFNGWTEGRLVWPYGDKVTGNYLTKVGLPAFVVIIGIAFTFKNKLVLSLSFAFTLLGLIFGVFTGERMNLLVKLHALFLGAITWRPSIAICLSGALLSAFGVALALIVDPDLLYRWTYHLAKTLPFYSESPYLRVYITALAAIDTNFLMGVGPATYEQLCPSIMQKLEVERFTCQPHPHNYFLQALVETGFVGFCSLLLLTAVMTFTTAKNWKSNDLFKSSAWIIVFALLFPLNSSSDLFGQWGNTFLWPSIAWALATAHYTSEKSH